MIYAGLSYYAIPAGVVRGVCVMSRSLDAYRALFIMHRALCIIFVGVVQ